MSFWAQGGRAWGGLEVDTPQQARERKLGSTLTLAVPLRKGMNHSLSNTQQITHQLQSRGRRRVRESSKPFPR